LISPYLTCRENELWRFNEGNIVPGLEFICEHLPWKRLPEGVFESIGGKAVAKMMRSTRSIQVSGSKKRPLNEMQSTPSAASSTPSKTSADDGVSSKQQGPNTMSATPSNGLDPLDTAPTVMTTPIVLKTEGEGEGRKSTAAKRRKLAAAEGVTSLGRSSAHTSNADVDNNKNLMLLSSRTQLNKTPLIIPHVAWKLCDIK
jgi:hypothetical protein